MLTGWKSIISYTGFSRNTLKRLMKDEGFPIAYIASKPTTTEPAVEAWFATRISAQRPPANATN